MFDAARVNLYGGIEGNQSILPGGVTFGISMTTVVLNQIEHHILNVACVFTKCNFNK